MKFKNLDGWTSGKASEPDLLNGLSRRERTFVLEKIIGRNDKDAALAAVYSLSMAENTKRKIWKPRVRAEFQRLTEAFVLQVHKTLLAKLEAEERNATASESEANARAVPIRPKQSRLEFSPASPSGNLNDKSLKKKASAEEPSTGFAARARMQCFCSPSGR